MDLTADYRMAVTSVSLPGEVGFHGEVFSGGLRADVETQVIKYRHGNSKEFSTIKMPGIKKTSNVTMKKGIFRSDNRFWDWFDQTRAGHHQSA